MRLFHFSDRGDIEEFVPRPPLRHPDAEAFVYAIDEWHSPNYLFPRDCPRIGVWHIETTTPGDRELCSASRMRFWIDARYEESWRKEGIFRYEFDLADGFVDCHDHGVWVSKATVKPIGLEYIADLPSTMNEAGVQVDVVPSLAVEAGRFYDFERGEFSSTLHVSMIRMSLLPDWKLEAGKPVRPQQA